METVLSTVKKMLELAGYTVLAAKDAIEAIQIVREQANDLVCVLLDFSMTTMNGIEAFEKMRQIRSDLPIILCSGYRPREVISYFEQKDRIGFLQKPFGHQDLMKKVKEMKNIKDH